jgi:hypothetical protein
MLPPGNEEWNVLKYRQQKDVAWDPLYGHDEERVELEASTLLPVLCVLRKKQKQCGGEVSERRITSLGRKV